MFSAALAVSRRVRHSWVPILVLIGLLCQTAVGLAWTAQDRATATEPPSQAPAPALARPLPDTDGDGLLRQPPAFELADIKHYFSIGKDACTVGCATSFGTVLGAADGVPAQSNCTPTCIHPEYSYLDLDTGAISVQARDPQQPNLRYVGLIYQCVEYARRWWMKNLGIAFGDVPGAVDIIYLTTAEDIRTHQSIALARSINGAAQRPPRRGDLVVYYPDRQDPEWRWGHVAVVIGVDQERGSVSLAEQNYSNAPWEDPTDHARRIRLFEVGGRYTLIDVSPTQVKNADGGRIAGWVYPRSAR
ncbi:hypothetical protein THSYN_15060 [Candidatus Thiodictyon syntrophicum]|uniref:Peptidase C51 domain-containing protein n=1 Tax=Candidatus Thiodictyon syntrophicum TaxID=1166950 RepID=A0A2K8UGW8_9GAMM|nr:hypothetical protein THSYN_15060 [Candidatus Thiodictyon syntrophicum]